MRELATTDAITDAITDACIKLLWTGWKIAKKNAVSLQLISSFKGRKSISENTAVMEIYGKVWAKNIQPGIESCSFSEYERSLCRVWLHQNLKFAHEGIWVDLAGDSENYSVMYMFELVSGKFSPGKIPPRKVPSLENSSPIKIHHLPLGNYFPKNSAPRKIPPPEISPLG